MMFSVTRALLAPLAVRLVPTLGSKHILGQALLHKSKSRRFAKCSALAHVSHEVSLQPTVTRFGKGGAMMGPPA